MVGGRSILLSCVFCGMLCLFVTVHLPQVVRSFVCLYGCCCQYLVDSCSSISSEDRAACWLTPRLLPQQQRTHDCPCLLPHVQRMCLRVGKFQLCERTFSPVKGLV
jgi:hypothetical protein